MPLLSRSPAGSGQVVLTSAQRIAFVMSPRLGDALLSMIVVNNLQRHGYAVTVFSDYLYALRDWFPGFAIQPAVPRAAAAATLREFDVLLHAYRNEVADGARDWHPNVLVMDEWPRYRQVKNMVEIQLDLCRHDFALADAVPENGLQPLAGLRPRAFPQRVVIHPTASALQKSWLPQRFAKLGQALRGAGFEPQFLLSRAELPDWSWLNQQGFAPQAFDSLSAVAAYLYESGWMIGNDSGIGHLASNVGVPVVTLAIRRKVAVRWRPGWSPSRTVLPLPCLPGRIAKEHLWKYFLPTSRVLRAFAELRAACGARART